MLLAGAFPRGYIKFKDGWDLEVKKVYLQDNKVYYKYNGELQSSLLNNIEFINVRGKFERGFSNTLGIVGLLGTAILVAGSENADSRKFSISFGLSATGVFYLGGRLLGWMVDPWVTIYSNPYENETNETAFQPIDSILTKKDTLASSTSDKIEPIKQIEKEKPKETLYSLTFDYILSDVIRPDEIIKIQQTSSLDDKVLYLGEVYPPGDGYNAGRYIDTFLTIGFRDAHKPIIVNSSDKTIWFNWNDSYLVTAYEETLLVKYDYLSIYDDREPPLRSFIGKSNYLDGRLSFISSDGNSMDKVFKDGSNIPESELPHVLEEAYKYTGKTFSLILDLEYNDVSYPYEFIFLVTGDLIYREHYVSPF